MGTYLGINVALVPFAQGIWGTQFLGYVGSFDCFNSVAMIAYSKGDLEFLLDTNPLYSMAFLFMYYIMLIYIMHSGFHMTQTDALKSVVKRYSIKDTDIIDLSVNKKAKDMTQNEINKMGYEGRVAQF